MTDRQVTIAGETGERLMVVRDSVVERNVTSHPVAEWPRDSAAQRVWALSAVIQNRPNYKDDIDFGDIFRAAERIVDWVNTGRDEGWSPYDEPGEHHDR